MQSPSTGENRLVREFSEAAVTRKILSFSAVGAAILGLAVMPVGLFLWGLALILAVAASRTTSRMYRIVGRVNTLRAFENPPEILPGSLVSLIPDPHGLGGDHLVGRVGATWEDGGDAEILSEPLGGKVWVRKHSGSFTISRGDWVVFHKGEDGTLTIWKEGSQYQEILDRAARTGDEKDRRLAGLVRFNQAQSRASQALEELVEAQEAFTGQPAEPPSSRTEPAPSEEVWGKQEIINRFRITSDYFEVKLQSYTFALQISGMNSNWNEDIDQIARENGALSEREIEVARTDFHQAVLNRIKLALTMERGGGI